MTVAIISDSVQMCDFMYWTVPGADQHRCHSKNSRMGQFVSDSHKCASTCAGLTVPGADQQRHHNKNPRMREFLVRATNATRALITNPEHVRGILAAQETIPSRVSAHMLPRTEMHISAYLCRTSDWALRENSARDSVALTAAFAQNVSNVRLRVHS